MQALHCTCTSPTLTPAPALECSCRAQSTQRQRLDVGQAGRTRLLHEGTVQCGAHSCPDAVGQGSAPRQGVRMPVPRHLRQQSGCIQRCWPPHRHGPRCAGLRICPSLYGLRYGILHHGLAAQEAAETPWG